LAADDAWPHAGETVEVIGFGGGRFRHYSAPVLGYTVKDSGGCVRQTLERNRAGDDLPPPAAGRSSECTSAAPVTQLVVAFEPISGDSGGAVLYNRRLAGVIWGGPCTGPQQPAYQAHATCCIFIRRFLNTLGLGVDPAQQPAAPSASSERGALVPLDTRPPAADSDRVAAIERRLDALTARLARLPPAAAGPPGPAGAVGALGPQGVPGPAGPAGKDADPAALTALTNRVTALETRLKGQLHFSLQVDPQTGKILSTSSGSR
jgi:hypothetical protein